MQTVKHLKSNIHRIFDDIERAYALTSEKKSQSLLPNVFDKSFAPLFTLFSDYGGVSYNVEYKDVEYFKLKVLNNNRIILCFSGGKDSIAALQHYLESGYEVYLYHMRKINPPLFDEYKAAEEIAKHYNVPIFVDEVKLSGNHDWVEHPMKNMIIANGALQYGLENAITTNIAFGNYSTSSVEDDNFGFCGGDDIEMWDAYNSIIRSVIPNFKMDVVLSNIAETLDVVCPNREILDMSISCLGRASMRDYWHNWVLNKYGITLPTHRCGRCYKCCIEYIYMADHNLQTYNEDYYRYCFSNLRKNVQREDGVRYSDAEVWNHYLFYDIKNSKCFGGHS